MNSSQVYPASRNERLLLVTDGSLFSEGAIREAIAFAKKYSSKLYAISVLVMNPEYETIGFDVFKKEEAEILKPSRSCKSKGRAGRAVMRDHLSRRL